MVPSVDAWMKNGMNPNGSRRKTIGKTKCILTQRHNWAYPLNLQITTTLADSRYQERQHVKRVLSIEKRQYHDIYMEFQTPGCVDSNFGELKVVKVKRVVAIKKLKQLRRIK